MKAFWQSLPWRARTGVGAGAALLLLLLAISAWWLLRTEYDILFADLQPRDAALMTDELERLNIPYRLGEDGSAILIEKSAVHATRLKLMGRELPLQGGVGLELFNNADIGMTEFTEKINYQRALQGELTRTILSLSEIRAARVHLAFAEQAVFRQGNARPKASVTLTMKPAEVLSAAQVAGITRLVAAAISGMTVEDVTIVDQRGIALTRGADGEGGSTAANGRLELKRETEDYLSRKAGTVLERALGPGQALASVDVALNMDQMRVTTEDVLPVAASQAGVVVHERETLGNPSAQADNRLVDGSRSNLPRQRETDYQTGKRVEQIVSQPGSIRRIQVVAVVRQSLDAVRREQLRVLVSAAVGAVPERGDVVVVEAFGEAQPGPAPGTSAAPPAASLLHSPAEAARQASASAQQPAGQALVSGAGIAANASQTPGPLRRPAGPSAADRWAQTAPQALPSCAEDGPQTPKLFGLHC
ncbi:MAG: flagellar basal-body MS-ring/collar protein FliF [Janthinobacterium lividum]